LRDIRKETEDSTVDLTNAQYTLGVWTDKAALRYLCVESKKQESKKVIFRFSTENSSPNTSKHTRLVRNFS